MTAEELSLSELEPLEQLRSQIRVKIEQARRAIQVQKASSAEPEGAPGGGGMTVRTNDPRFKRPRFCS